MLIESLQIRNLLSFGPDSEPLELGPLNVLIGPNGSGKSNLVEVLELLTALSTGLGDGMASAGGIGEWLHRDLEGKVAASARLLALARLHDLGKMGVRFQAKVSEQGHRLRVDEEAIHAIPSDERSMPGDPLYRMSKESAEIHARSEGLRPIDPSLLKRDESILSQRRDPEAYPELTHLADALGSIRVYREWQMGSSSPMRRFQKADLPNDFLRPDGSNFGVILSRLTRAPAVKKSLLSNLRELYSGIEDLDLVVEAGHVQVFVTEGNRSIPASRLSDGTLRFLFLLVLLCDPDPPPLLAIEEPELGLHPDLLPVLADLLVGASERTQLVVTTHSDILIDALGHHDPSTVVVVESEAGSTRLRRLDPEALKVWLDDDYGLGQLWNRGDLGGKRW